MQKLAGLIRFGATNFGPILAFYLGNHFGGIKAGVIASVAWTFIEIISHRIQKKPTTTFFKFSATIAILFGIIDLYLQQSIFFKYEAALSNVMVGVFFAASLYGEKPIIREFAEAQGRVAENIPPDAEYYFKFLTVVWSLYSFAKAGFYAWVAANYSLEEGLAFRAVVGNGTFYALLFLSIFCSKQIRAVLGKLKMLPSSRAPMMVSKT